MSQRYPLIALLALLVAPLAQGSTGTLDQSFTPFLGNGHSHVAVSFAPGFEVQPAQGFTVGMDGTLVCVEILVDRATDGLGDLQLEIQPVDGTGAPTNTVLASATRPMASIPLDSPSWVAFDLSGDALAVASGERYAIVLRTEERSVSSTFWYRWFGEADPAALYLPGNTWVRLNDGGWSMLGNDTGFRTYVSTVVPVEAATWGGIKRQFAVP